MRIRDVIIFLNTKIQIQKKKTVNFGFDRGGKLKQKTLTLSARTSLL